MANAIWDERNEPHRTVAVVGPDGFAGFFRAVETMTLTTGNRIAAVCVDGLSIEDAETGRLYRRREASVTLEEARRFGYGKTDEQIAAELIAEIERCEHIHALHAFERRARPVWKRLIRFVPGGAYPLSIGRMWPFEDRLYFSIMASYARRQRKIFGHPEVDLPEPTRHPHHPLPAAPVL